MTIVLKLKKHLVNPVKFLFTMNGEILFHEQTYLETRCNPCAAPPIMVTCGTMEHSNIITVAWTGIVNTIPPMTYISIRPERYSYRSAMRTR